jgi:hypothetical protein
MSTRQFRERVVQHLHGNQGFLLPRAGIGSDEVVVGPFFPIKRDTVASEAEEHAVIFADQLGNIFCQQLAQGFTPCFLTG